MIDRLGLNHPIIQAPMAGVSTPEMAAAVSDAGALGSIGVGATDASGAAAMIDAVRTRTDRAFNVNLFVHEPPNADAVREADWLTAMRPLFAKLGAEPPVALRSPYRSFREDVDMLRLLLDRRPPVVSFHFGLPDAEVLAALRSAGCLLLVSVTSPDEARLAERAGIDVLVAQGWEAGGHRGMFDPAAADDRLGTMALTRLLARQSSLPVVAAGGIMDGAAIRAALALGAVAAQLGTAFIACPETSASPAHRAALTGEPGRHTVMTNAISGRPARCVANDFTQWASATKTRVPAYPLAYDAGKALHMAAQAAGSDAYGAHWAGQGAPLARAMPAADLVATLVREMRQPG